MENDIQDGNMPLSKTEQDFRDLNNEMAGRETGRIRRFFSEASSETAVRNKRDREAHQLSALILRLQNDAQYAVIYNETVDQLRHYELAAERALTDAIARNDQTEIDSIRHYQVEVLGHARERLMDEENPLSKDELRDIQKQFEEGVAFGIEKFQEPSGDAALPLGSPSSDFKVPPIT